MAVRVQVRDAVFLHRYSEPVLLVLHKTAPTWSGNLRARKDTMAATALSVNVLHKRLTLLWSAKDLPSDACRLHAAPLGGALVMCRSLIKYISQASCETTVSFISRLQACKDVNLIPECFLVKPAA